MKRVERGERGTEGKWTLATCPPTVTTDNRRQFLIFESKRAAQSDEQIVQQAKEEREKEEVEGGPLSLSGSGRFNSRDRH